MSDIRIDVPNLTVTVQKIGASNVNINQPTQTVRVTGSLTQYTVTALTSSYALTASYISGVARASSFEGQFTGSFSGSYKGDGSGLSGVVASGVVVNISDDNVNRGTAQVISFDSLLSASVTNNTASISVVLPSGTVSSSLQVNTGSFSGSFGGILTGTATTASYIDLARTAISSSWASSSISASYAPTILPSGVVSSSAQATTWTVASSSYAATASFASNVSAADFNTLLNKPTLVSSSAQINTGSFSGSFTGPHTGTSSWASSAITASYVQSASYAPTLLPSGVVSSSAQATTWTVASASLATSASYALTASYVSGAASTWDTISNKPSGLVSSSLQINTGSFSGSFTGTLIGTSSWAQQATSASYAPTILPSGTVSSSGQINYNQIQNQPTTIATASFATFAVSAGSSTSASYALTASYVSGAVSDWNTLVGKPAGLVSSSVQINTGSFTGSFTGTFIGTSSWAVSSSRATTASFAISSSFAPTILPSGVVSSSAQAITWTVASASVATSSISSSFATTASFAHSASAATSITFVPTTASFATTSSYATIAQNVLGSITSASYAATASLLLGSVVSASYALTSSFAQLANTASYVSGGIIIIGTPTDASYGGSAGNVSGISAGDRAEDAFDKVETILGKLAPAKPANLSTRTLTTNATVYTAFTASGGTPASFSNITTTANPTSSWTFVAATSGSTTTLSFDADAGTLQAEVDSVISAASQDIMTTASDSGTYGNLIVTSDLDPYNGTFGQQGFWKGFIASVAPTSSLALGPHTSRLLHSTTGNTPVFTWYLDNPTTPSITVITGSSTGGATRLVSGVPTLATGETVIIQVTGSNAVSQFYNGTRIFAAVGNNSVAPSVNATLPAVPPVSASAASASITLTVATNAFTSASTYTATIYNSAGTTATATWTPTAPMRVDTISNESTRCRSGIGWYPNIDGSVSGAGAIWTASANLTGSRELQMTNNLYHYPSASNYATNYPTPGPNYIGLVAETTASFSGEAVRWTTFSGSVNAASNVSVVFAGTNAAFTGVQTTGSMRLYVQVSGSTPTNGWIDGATAYPGSGNPLNNGDPALVVGSSTTTTKIVTFGGLVKTGVVFVRVGIPSSSLAGSTRVFSGVTITQV